MIETRMAQVADREAIEDLRNRARIEVLDKRGGQDFAATELESALVPLGDIEPSAAVIVGCINGVVVGVASVSQRGHKAQLGELFVRPDAREVGVGHAVLGLVTEQARSWGCTSIDSYALPGDRETKNFFESHAMKSRLLIVSQQLSAADDNA